MAAPEPGGQRMLSPAFVALAAATLAFFVAGGIVLPVAALYARGPLDAEAMGVGVAIGSFSIASLIMRPVVGWSSDRFGRRPLLVGGSVLTVAALAFHLVATNLPLFIVARSLLGIGEGFFFVAALAAASDIAPPARRGEALSILSLSLYLGLAIGPAIGETVLRAADYGAAWLVAAAFALVAVVLSWFTPETSAVVIRGGDEARNAGRFFHPAGIFPGVIILTAAWGMGGFLTFLPLHAVEIGLDGAGLALAAYGGLIVALRIFGARLPDRLGAAPLAGTALACSAIGLAILGSVSLPIGMYAGAAIYAVGVAFTFPALVTFAVSRVPESERGSVVGTTTLFLDLAFGIAPALLGFVAESAGYSGAFLVSAAIAGVGCLLIVARRGAMVRPAAA